VAHAQSSEATFWLGWTPKNIVGNLCARKMDQPSAGIFVGSFENILFLFRCLPKSVYVQISQTRQIALSQEKQHDKNIKVFRKSFRYISQKSRPMSFFGAASKKEPKFRGVNKNTASRITHPAFKDFKPTSITKEQQEVRNALADLDRALEYEAVKQQQYEKPDFLKLNFTLTNQLEAGFSFSYEKHLFKPGTFEAAFVAFLKSECSDYVFDARMTEKTENGNQKQGERSGHIKMVGYKRNAWRLKSDIEKFFHPMRCFYGGFPKAFLERFDALQEELGGKLKKRLLEKQQPMQQYLKPEFFAMLHDYQKEGIAYAALHNFCFLIGDEMGLGKTFQALGCIQWVHAVEKSKKFLIVCPSSLRIQWKHELVERCGLKTVAALKGSDIEVYSKEIHDAMVISYDLVSNHAAKIRELQFNFIVLDESHMIKSAAAKRTRNIRYLCQQIEHRLLLSGTPALAKPIELYTQIEVVRPNTYRMIEKNFEDDDEKKDKITEYHAFGMRYCGGFQIDNPALRAVKEDWKRKNMPEKIWIYPGCVNASELFLTLEKNIMIRRQKKNVLSQLPDKVRTRVFIPTTIPKSVKNIMSGAKKQVEKENFSQIGGVAQDSPLLQAYALMPKFKKAAVCEYIADLLENLDTDKKFLVMAHHKIMLDDVQELLTKKKVAFMRIDGSVDAKKRAAHVKSFQEDSAKKCRVALLSITAAGVGLTLTKASLVVFAELHWTPGILLQAEDRCHRIGQKECVDIRYLVSEDSFETPLWKKILTKMDQVSQITGGVRQKDGMQAKTVTKKRKIGSIQTKLSL